MKNKAVMLNKKYLALGLLLAIFLIGTFLRSYNFSDWLHFELDQSRDAKVINLAIDEGIGNLPLLGPKAAGSFLRLGPAFYNTNYLSAKIFGNTPAGHATLSLIFSCFTILIFYLLFKRYFKENISLILTALSALSLFLIMYSRFTWNPNVIPFFGALTVYSLLSLSDEQEKRRGIWLIICSVAISIVTQLHFLAFMAIPTISFIFIIWKRPKIKIKYWLLAFLTIVLFYTPLIINDFKTGGDNIKEFTKAFTKKSTKDTHNTIEKIWKDATENSIGYFLVLTSSSNSELPKLKGTDIQCDGGCRKNLPLGILSLAFWGGGLILLAFKLKDSLQHKNEIDTKKKDFIILISIWIIISFGIFYPIAYDIAPRFWLLLAPMPFIFLGLYFEKIMLLIKNKKIALGLILIILLTILFSDLKNITQRFSEMKRSPYEVFDTESDKILKERNSVTLEQQLMITDYIQSKYEKNDYPVYINSDPFYRRSFLYHLEDREIPRDDFRNTTIGKTVYEEGNYFLIYPALSNTEKDLEKYGPMYDLIEERNFGTLTVFQLAPKKEAITDLRQEFEPAKKARSASGVPVRCRWNEIFNQCNPDEILNSK